MEVCEKEGSSGMNICKHTAALIYRTVRSLIAFGFGTLFIYLFIYFTVIKFHINHQRLCCWQTCETFTEGNLPNLLLNISREPLYGLFGCVESIWPPVRNQVVQWLIGSLIVMALKVHCQPINSGTLMTCSVWQPWPRCHFSDKLTGWIIHPAGCTQEGTASSSRG